MYFSHAAQQAGRDFVVVALFLALLAQRRTAAVAFGQRGIGIELALFVGPVAASGFHLGADLGQYLILLRDGLVQSGDEQGEIMVVRRRQAGLGGLFQALRVVLAIDQQGVELAPGIAKHGCFNFLLSNGDALWAHCSTRLWYLERKHPFAHAQLADEDLSIDFAQHTTPEDKVAVVVTAPLTVDERWIAFQPGELKVFVDGQAR